MLPPGIHVLNGCETWLLADTWLLAGTWLLADTWLLAETLVPQTVGTSEYMRVLSDVYV